MSLGYKKKNALIRRLQRRVLFEVKAWVVETEMDSDTAEMLDSNEHNHDIIGLAFQILESVFQRHKVLLRMLTVMI